MSEKSDKYIGKPNAPEDLFEGPQIFGHPKGLMTLFFTEMWERFSYYGMRALLILFMTTAVVDGGLGFDDKTSGAIYGLYSMGVYLLALPGGWAADRILGLKKSVWYGGIIITLGHFTMAFPGVVSLFASTSGEKTALTALDTNSFFLGLILIVLGTGLLKPNISSIVGKLYPDGSSKRDAGFSIFYMGINLGALFAPIACSTFEIYDWRLGIGGAGFGMLMGLVQYKLTDKHLEGVGEEVIATTPEEQKKRAKIIRMSLIALGLTALLILLIFLGAVSIDAIGLAAVSNNVIAIVALLYFG